jgi:hypothetical protein
VNPLLPYTQIAWQPTDATAPTPSVPGGGLGAAPPLGGGVQGRGLRQGSTYVEDGIVPTTLVADAVDLLGLRLGKATTAAAANIVAARVHAVGKAEASRGAAVARWLTVCGVRSGTDVAVNSAQGTSACDKCGQTAGACWRVHGAHQKYGPHGKLPEGWGGRQRADALVEAVIETAVAANPLAAPLSPVCDTQRAAIRNHYEGEGVSLCGECAAPAVAEEHARVAGRAAVQASEDFDADAATMERRAQARPDRRLSGWALPRVDAAAEHGRRPTTFGDDDDLYGAHFVLEGVVQEVIAVGVSSTTAVPLTTHHAWFCPRWYTDSVASPLD